MVSSSLSTNQPNSQAQSFLSTSQTAPDPMFLGLNGAGSSLLMNGTLGRNHTSNPLVQTLLTQSAANGHQLNPELLIDPTYLTSSSRLVDSIQKVQPIYQQPQQQDSIMLVERKTTSKCHCYWYYWIISILVLAFLLALVLAVSFSG